METPFLNQHQVQTIDLSLLFERVAPEQFFLVYAPLSDLYFVADSDTLSSLEKDLLNNISDSSLGSIIQQIKSPDLARIEDRIIKSPSQQTKLSILPNLICNFSCIYCYSAKGRSNSQLQIDKLQPMLNYFFDPNRISSKERSLFISGGGEPLMSWNIVQYIINFAIQASTQYEYHTDIMLMTNGSLLSDERIAFLRDNHVNVGVSFEILPDVQNLQRGHFDIVSNNIQKMIDMDYSPSISSVITPSNVSRMEAMVQQVLDSYQGIRHLNFDPAMSPDLFYDVDSMDRFYDSFYHHFFSAKRLCGEHYITLDCNIIRRAEKIFPRYCQGQLCIVPNGDISICHTVSSPKEDNYVDFIYGHVSNQELIFDNEHYSSLIDTQPYILDRCNACIARWHCSGGCLMYRRHYDDAHFAAVCRFTQRMIGAILISRLDYAYRQQHGSGLDSLLNID